MSRYVNRLSVVCGTALAVSVGLMAPALAQESDAESVDLTEVVEHIAEDNSAMLAQAPESQIPDLSSSPLARMAKEAATLLAGVQGASPSIGGANPMCPVLRKWSRGGCGVSSVLTGENAITDEQYEKFYQIKMKMKDEYGPMRTKYYSHKRHLKDLMTQDEIDTKAVKKMNEQISSLKKDMTALKLDYKLQMAQVLTGAQRSALRKAMIKKKMGSCSRGSYMMKRMMKNWKHHK